MKPTYEELEARIASMEKAFKFWSSPERTIAGLYAIYNADGAGASPAPVSSFARDCMNVAEQWLKLDQHLRDYYQEFAGPFLQMIYEKAKAERDNPDVLQP